MLHACQSATKKNTNTYSSLEDISKKDSVLYYQKIKSFFDTTLFTSNFNGGLLIAKGDTILYEVYKGYKDLRKKDTMDAHTPMHIASVSKTFTAMAVLKLVQEQKLHLEDTLGKFFAGTDYGSVTVKMLLCHRSGLPNYINYMDKTGWDKKKYVTNADVINSLVTYHPAPEAKPGAKFQYSNTNYVLLAAIIEKVSGISYAEFIKANFFDPFGMKDSYIFSMKDSLTATRSFTPSGGLWAWDFLDDTYGDKNIYTTPQDMLRWSLAVSNHNIINKQLLDTAFTPMSNDKPSVHNYGLGWRMLLIPNGKKVIYHYGRWHGSNIAFAKLFDEGITIIIIGNRFNRRIYNTARRSYDIFGPYLQNNVPVEENDIENTENTSTQKTSKAASTKKAR